MNDVGSLSLAHPSHFINREKSWLYFNDRVLHEALDPRTPLLEQVKFLAIFSTNLDEYFMVRIDALRDQVEANVTTPTPDGLTPQQQLDLISTHLAPVITQQHDYFAQNLRPRLAEAGIIIADYPTLTPEQQAYLHNDFMRQVFPILTPLAVDPGHPFPYMSNLSLNLAVLLQDTKTGQHHFARVKVPTKAASNPGGKALKRFVTLPEPLRPPGVRWLGVPLEQVIGYNLAVLFPGMDLVGWYPFRVTRDADLAIREDEAGDLLAEIEKEVRSRRYGRDATRLEIVKAAPELVRETLTQGLNIQLPWVYEVNTLLNLGDLMELAFLPYPELRDSDWTPVLPALFEEKAYNDAYGGVDWFNLIQQGDVLVHHPYHSFAGTVERFIAQAAKDPEVLGIKMTLYRTSGDSPIVQSLILAAENGIQVAVLVELKARFDEENNILWARRLEQAGVHVVYGLIGLKTHSKLALVVRREGEGIRRYMHLGTGNYNSKTARIYTDLGILTCRDDLAADVTELFNFLTGYSRQRQYRQLLVAPVNMREEIVRLIRQEADQARLGQPARIFAKMNALADTAIILELYQAAQAGVEIRLLIRGMCTLRPGVPGLSEGIQVVSIIGRFLEHSRVFGFHNGGQENLYIGSADWRTRNLDRRVEALTPVLDGVVKQQLQEIMELMWMDNRQAWDLQPDGTYIQRQPALGEAERGSHALLMQRTLAEATPVV
ncbi:polyphosphatee kinase [Gloeomargarita lithophora Alchichica-D10]|uniref:Polyphosphate kinase n=1 Tax=Gloeomargarita lithophora Alchichica-D10 TaxID=1188229 RepID=A0A1J0AGB8_9CYAN|nr:polyphosphate kinase 1 [Gloeomargarita lithophora]APB34931.1 polyphosphatee kinase [Gloeomargarita lithophora Alchichica-D10]